MTPITFLLAFICMIIFVFIVRTLTGQRQELGNFHRVENELEAKLRPSVNSQCPTARGEVEISHYTQGGGKIKVKLYNIDEITNGTDLDVLVNNQALFQVPVMEGTVYFRTSEISDNLKTICQLGAEVRIEWNNQAIVQGQFYRD